MNRLFYFFVYIFQSVSAPDFGLPSCQRGPAAGLTSKASSADTKGLPGRSQDFILRCKSTPFPYESLKKNKTIIKDKTVRVIQPGGTVNHSRDAGACAAGSNALPWPTPMGTASGVGFYMTVLAKI